jgi:transposase
MSDSGPFGNGETIYATSPKEQSSAARDLPEGEEYKDANWLYIRYWVLKNSANDIADMCDVSRRTIMYYLDKFGIERRDTQTSLHLKRGYKELGDGDWLRKKYVEEGLTGTEIADMLGCLHKSVYKALDEHGIQRRSEADSQNVNKKYTDGEWLFVKIHLEGKQLQEIADACGVCYQTIVRWRKKLDVPEKSRCEINMQTTRKEMKVERKDGELKGISDGSGGLDLSFRDIQDRIYQGEWVPYRDREWIYEKYVEKGMSGPEIAELADCNHSTIYKWLDRFDIERCSPGHGCGCSADSHDSLQL